MDKPFSKRRPAPDGDAALAGLLRRDGSRYDVPAVKALVAGVLAAAPGAQEGDWPRLVVAAPSPALVEALRALAAELAGAPATPLPGPGERLGRLRAELARRGVHGFLVPRADEHQGEYVPACARRLAWLTGFTGSAGLAVVLPAAAAIFVDGRYTLQAKAEVDAALYLHRHITEEPASDWIAATLRSGEILAYDPRLHTLGEVERFRAAAEKAGGSLRPLAENPLDAVWPGRPPLPLAPVVPHELRFAGDSAEHKRQRLADRLAAERVDAVVLTAPDSIAWLLNIRGGDVPHTPLPLSFAILGRDGTVDLFIDPRKLIPGLGEHLGNAVRLAPPDAFGPALRQLGAAHRRVQVDPASAAAWVFDALADAGAELHRAADPCQLPKACKNPVELDGTRRAHRRDGAALTRFLAWLAGEARSGTLGEIAASDRLEQFRRAGEHFRDLSFPTISGAGANGAIVHYRAGPESERRLEPGTLYLIDSGAQYLDGTTDVTRTVAIGTPTPEMRDRFTRVLKGHIALATCRFPKGTTGSQLDALARRALWEVGLDYDHGTGHGVGSYLAVHEGPQRISKLPNTQPLLPGMIVSDEPGYYKAGAYGIRIENLVLVTPLGAGEGGERELLGFETLTLAPLDRALVEPALLDGAEIAWLDAYHARVRAEIAPLVDAATRRWLEAATEPIGAD
ncbi:MAG TPA: aminopeptidase P family protein [Stellaceae bacterium]|nr:aminopeptidase P family protein [Stellaceae bacterium]